MTTLKGVAYIDAVIVPVMKREAEALVNSPWRNPGPKQPRIRDEEWPLRILQIMADLNAKNARLDEAAE